MLPTSQPNNQNTPEPIKVPIRDAATAQQVNTVLGIFGMALSALNSITRMDTDLDEEDNTRRLLTGESRVAAETTFINCCETLDRILKDSSRWSMEHQDRIERERQLIQDAQIRVLEANASAAEEIMTPHFRYHPAIARATDGDWIAFIGDPEDLRNAIVGMGQSPQEALNSFDRQFERELSPAIRKWLATREQNLNQGLPTTDPFPKATDNEMDSTARQSTDDTETSGEDGQRDSDDTEGGLPTNNTPSV